MSRSETFPQVRPEGCIKDSTRGRRLRAHLGIQAAFSTSRVREKLARGDQIPWPHPECRKIADKLLDGTYTPGCEFEGVQDPLLRKHLIRLGRSLLWWQDNLALRGRKGFALPHVIMAANLIQGPKFADELDDRMKMSYREVSGTRLFSFEDEGLIDDEAWGFDYFFSPFHLMPFQRGSCKDAFDLAFAEPPSLDLRDLAKLRQHMEDFIKVIKQKPIFDDVDELNLWGSSSTLCDFEGNTAPKTMKMGTGIKPHLTEHFFFKEVSVYKNPHESRACWIADMDTLYTLKVLHSQLKKVLNHPDDYYSRRPSYDRLVGWLSERPGQWFILSDLRKSGLTMPRLLQEVARGALKSANPEWDFNYLIGFQQAYVVREDGSRLRSTNGYGLGMMDILVSFIVSCIFSLWKETLSDRIAVHGMFWGDDQAIKVYNQYGAPMPIDEAEELAEDWNRFMSKHGLAVNEKKPFVSARGVLLETYGQEWINHAVWDHKKLAQWMPAFYWSMCAANIVEAKCLVKDINNSIWDDWAEYIDYAIQDQIAFWGTEFTEYEVHLPWELGGWIQFLGDGMNQALMKWSELPEMLLKTIRIWPHQGIKHCRRAGFKMNSLLFDERSHNKGPSFTRMLKAVMNPDILRPSSRRLLERWEQLATARQEAWQGKMSRMAAYQWAFDNVEMKGLYEVPEVLCKRSLGTSGGPELDYPDGRGRGVDGIRAWLWLESTSLKLDVPEDYTYSDAQIDYLKSIDYDVSWFSIWPELVVWGIENEASAKELRYYGQRGFIPKLKRENKKSIEILFPKLSPDASVVIEDPWTKMWFLGKPGDPQAGRPLWEKLLDVEVTLEELKIRGWIPMPPAEEEEEDVMGYVPSPNIQGKTLEELSKEWELLFYGTAYRATKVDEFAQPEERAAQRLEFYQDANFLVGGGLVFDDEDDGMLCFFDEGDGG